VRMVEVTWESDFGAGSDRAVDRQVSRLAASRDTMVKYVSSGAVRSEGVLGL